MVKKAVICLWVLSCLLLTTGCWDNRDVTKVNFVTAVGLDLTEDDKIEVTVEIPKPGNIVAALRGGGGMGQNVVIYTNTGDTVFQAVRDSLKGLNKKLVWTQLGLVVIGEDIAREGILEILDFMERDPESNLTARVLIAKGRKVKDIMELNSELEKIPSQHILKTIEINRKALGTASKIRLIDIVKMLAGKGCNAALPVLTLKQGNEELAMKNIQVEGLALLKKDRLVGFLDADQSRGWSISRGDLQSTVYNVPNPFDEEKQVVFEIEQAEAQREVEFKDGQMKIKISIEARGNIGEIEGLGDFSQDENIVELKKQIGEVIKAEIKDTVETAQKLETDVLGFGNIYHRKNPSQWKKIQEEWDSYFSEGALEVEVNVKIERSGYVLPRLHSVSDYPKKVKE